MEGEMAEHGATATRILEAARSGLLTDGYAGLSTRKVAELAEREPAGRVRQWHRQQNNRASDVGEHHER